MLVEISQTVRGCPSASEGGDVGLVQAIGAGEVLILRYGRSARKSPFEGGAPTQEGWGMLVEISQTVQGCPSASEGCWCGSSASSSLTPSTSPCGASPSLRALRRGMWVLPEQSVELWSSDPIDIPLRPTARSLAGRGSPSKGESLDLGPAYYQQPRSSHHQPSPRRTTGGWA